MPKKMSKGAWAKPILLKFLEENPRSTLGQIKAHLHSQVESWTAAGFPAEELPPKSNGGKFDEGYN